MGILDKHAPLKRKTIRANHAPYMTKDLKKAIMKRTHLANKYQKTKSETDYRNFRKQKNYVDRLYKREKNIFFSNLSMKELTDNKKFWRTTKQLFPDETKGGHKITLVKGDEIIFKSDKVAQEFGDKFSNAVGDLNIPDIPVSKVPSQLDIVDTAILIYQNHPSIIKIIERSPITLE